MLTTTRAQRRAAEHLARKAARKALKTAAVPTTTPTADPVIDAAVTAEAAATAPPSQPACAPDRGIVCGEPHCSLCIAYFGEDDEDEQLQPAAAPAPQSDDDLLSQISAARLAANRANSLHSTGPTSSAGKAKVAQNAVKTALTGRAVLLPFDDTEAYQALLLAYQKEFQPVGPVETGLVQSIVDSCWRLERIPGLEYAQIEIGQHILRVKDPIFSAAASPVKLELSIRQIYEKELRNLHLQENRLVRRRDREMKELRALQETRKAKEAEELKVAAQAALVAQHQNQPFNLTELGFDFSTQRFSSYMARLTPAMKQNLLNEALAHTAQTAKPMQTAA